MSFALSDLISERARAWADAEKHSARSAVGDVLRCAERVGRLREPQLRAVENYLWLKWPGGNRPLSDLVLAGMLADRRPGARSTDAPARQFVAAFARAGGLRRLENAVLRAAEAEIAPGLRRLLRHFPYPNYLFSLPMGAGKTWLMSAFICLDLHFSRLLPDDPRFARNFVVFAPHAAKTAILPALKTIRDFDPEWILPPAAAAEVRRELRVEMLDRPAAAKRDTRVNNPNLEKVNRLAAGDPRGLVFITNAEKVVLEKSDAAQEYQAKMGARAWDEVEKTNALREKMADIPALSVLLDEVHHAYAGDGGKEKKLRLAVDALGKNGNLTSVLGFSGTPYAKTEAEICGVAATTPRLQDAVYDFPLARGVGNFLKTPVVAGRDDARESSFVHEALTQFFAEYDREYQNGTKSKIAFYCPEVRALNEDILPVVRAWFAENRPGREEEIFSFYAADRHYPLPKSARAEFHNLDSPQSRRRVVLLVAVGREGWDCRSLTAVALPRAASSRNFVLQTTCRCLREADNAADEAALIFLGDGNYDKLEEELKRAHDTTIRELESGAADRAPIRARKPRLGALRFKQVRRRLTVRRRDNADHSAARLRDFSFQSVRAAFPYAAVARDAVVTPRGRLRGKTARPLAAGADEFVSPVESFRDFLMELSRALWGAHSAAELAREHGPRLRKIHAAFGEPRNREWLANHPQGGADICREAVRRVAARFADARQWQSEEIAEDAEIQLLEWRDGGAGGIPWGTGLFLPELARHELPKLRKYPHRLDDEVADLDPNDLSFNYAPYRFASGLEAQALRAMLRAPFLRDFELYYNGMVDGRLESFQIQTPAGIYTPDFLLLQRRGGRAHRGGDAAPPAEIERVLIIETKGAPFDDAAFQAREKFVKTAFQRYNPNFRYVRLPDAGGQDDKNFGARLAVLEEQVQKWAAGEQPT